MKSINNLNYAINQKNDMAVLRNVEENVNGLVSIVIPSYNTARYLGRCLDSVLKQTYKKIEIIIIDDGSEDATSYLCKEYCEKNENVRYLYTEHKGPGNARNIGKENANGRYIMFVDSDDTIHNRMVEEMVNNIIDEKSDISICNVKMFFNSDTYVVQNSINWGEWNKKNYIKNGINLCSCCNKLFKREQLQNIEFSHITYEDMEIIPCIIANASKISFVRKHFYEYRLRPDSTTGCNTPFPIEDYKISVMHSVSNMNKDFIQEYEYWQARSFLDICNRNDVAVCAKLSLWKYEHTFIFDNELIRNDIYLRRILNKNSCFLDKVEFENLFSIIMVDETEHLEIPDTQILTKKQFMSCALTGKYTIFVDKIKKEDIEELKKIVPILDSLVSRICVFMISQNETQKFEIKNVFECYKNVDIFNNIGIYSTDFVNTHFLKVDIDILSILGCALLYEPNIAAIRCQLNLNEMISMAGNINPEKRIWNVCKSLIKYSISICMGVPIYVQYWIAKYIKSTIEDDKSLIDLNEDDAREIKVIIGYCLQNIEDKILLNIPKTTPEHKVFMTNYKYGCLSQLNKTEDGCEIVQNNHVIYNQENTYTMFEFCSYNGKEIVLEGRTICLNALGEESIVFFAIANSQQYIAEVLPRECSRYWNNEIVYKGTEFRLRIPIDKSVGIYELSFYYIYRGYLVKRKDIRFGKYFPINSKLRNSYYKKCDRVLTYDNKNYTLKFRLCGKKGHIYHEKKLLEEIKGENPIEYREIWSLRLLYYWHKYFSRKPIWLVSDKAHRADDNGEAFFVFLNQREQKHKVRSYYIYQKNNFDYKRIRKIGPIVEFNSFKHKLYSLICQYQFGAYAHLSIVCPLFDQRIYFQDLLCVDKMIFLQHGVTQNDYSSALNRYIQNFKGIITSNAEEAQSFISCRYYYKPSQIKLLGLPRYDRLCSNEKKIITFAPTWRRYLFGEYIQKEERYVLKNEFYKSDFYMFYRKVLTSERLRIKLKKYGYELHLIPHPVFFPYIDIFRTEGVVVHGNEVSYREMYEISSLFVTDYSSAVFDFAYLKKPIIYAQFDRKQFYESQYDKGYFNYETQGFGEIVMSPEELIDIIIEYVESGCKMKPVYKERVQNFFQYNDRNNCKRIWDEYYN